MAVIPPENVRINRFRLAGSTDQHVVTYEWTVVAANDSLAAESVDDGIQSAAAIKGITAGVENVLTGTGAAATIALVTGIPGDTVLVVGRSLGRSNRLTWAGAD